MKNVRTDLLLKLLARGLDPACSLGEAENAAAKMIIVARNGEMTVAQFCNALSLSELDLDSPSPHSPGFDAYAERTDPYRYRSHEPAECRLELPFGPYRGWSLINIARENPNYLKHIAINDRSDFWRWAASVVIRWVRNGAVRAKGGK